jgi:hypothetical protein
MSWILIVVVVLLAFLALAALRDKAASSTSALGFPYQPAKTLFSAAERSFLGVLDQAVGAEHRVFGKVRVADVATVKAGLGASARRAALNRVAAKHFDFVVCRSSDLTILCAVELNDKSHSSQRAQLRDDFLANVCRAIKLPLLQIAAKQSYSPHELREQFLALIASPLPGEIVGN